MATPLPEATLQTAIDSDAYEQALNLAKDSLAKASTPEPFSHSKTSNWVAKGGGLPPYIQHIAHDLMEKRGMPESRAIAMAIGIVRNWKDGKGNVDATTRAAAAKAWAEWEALKAKAHAKSAAHASAQTDEFDPTLYLSALVQERESLDMAVFSFDPNKHQRDFHGRFKAMVNGLKPGDKVTLPDGVSVKRSNDGKGFHLHPGGNPGRGVVFPRVNTVDEAVDGALNYSAKSKHPHSLGGSTQHKNSVEAGAAMKRGATGLSPSQKAAARDRAAANRRNELSRAMAEHRPYKRDQAIAALSPGERAAQRAAARKRSKR